MEDPRKFPGVEALLIDRSQPGCHHEAKGYLVELEELLLLPQGVCGCAGVRRGLRLRRLRKAVVAVRVRPLQDAPAVHNLT